MSAKPNNPMVRFAAFLHWAERLHGRLWSTLARVAEEDPQRRLAPRIARVLRVSVLAMLSFAVNEVPVRAAALVFTTMIAFIPITIILSSVAGWMGYLDLISRLIPYFVSSLNLDLPLDPVLDSLERAEDISFRQLGFWGSVGLLISFLFSMGTIEGAMNRVWNVRNSRGWLGRVRRYLPFLGLLLLLLAFTVGLLFWGRAVLESWGWGARYTGYIPGRVLVFGSAGLLGFLWVLIFLMIRLLPNARVRFESAFLGSAAAILVLYFLTRLLLLFPRALVERNQAFYGSLAAFPVALLMVYAFWITSLFGAAVAFVHQQLRHLEGRRFFVRGSSGIVRDWKEAMRETRALYSEDEPPAASAG